MARKAKRDYGDVQSPSVDPNLEGRLRRTVSEDLFVQSDNKVSIEPQMVALDLIDANPFQPRTSFGLEAIMTLAGTIREQGLLQPVILRRVGNRFELVAGERRVRACRSLGWNAISAVVKSVPDEQMLSLSFVENKAREDFNDVERFEAVLAILGQKFGISRGEVVARVRSVEYRLRSKRELDQSDGDLQEYMLSLGEQIGSFAANLLPLLKLPDRVYKSIASGKLEYTKGRVLSRVPDEVVRDQLLDGAVTESWSVSQCRAKVSEYFRCSKSDADALSSDVVALSSDQISNLFAEYFGGRARVKRGDKGWQVQLHGLSDAKLRDVLAQLGMK